MDRYTCSICGHVYDPAYGEPDNSIAPGIEFSALPEDWHCPICGASKTKFFRSG